MAMATRFDRGLSVVAFLCDWVWSWRDNEIISWWGGGNFFFHLKFVTTRQNNFLVVGWGHSFTYVTTRQNNYLVVGWGQLSIIGNLWRRDNEKFSRWVKPTKSSLFNYIWFSLHHPPRENYFVSWWQVTTRQNNFLVEGGGHFILFQMPITWEP